MFNDLNHAWRALRHRPGASLTAVFCLAIGIGANTTLFGTVDALLFRPPAGVADPDELVRVRIGRPGGPTMMGAGPSMTFPQLRIITEHLGDVAEVAAYAPRPLGFGTGAGADQLDGIIATAEYFEVLGVEPYRGRFFRTGEDDVPGARPVAVLSHRAWERLFDASPAALGRDLVLNGVPVTIVGVAPREFAGVDLGDPDVWLAIGAAADPAFGGPGVFTARTYWLQAVARRKPGVTPAGLAHVVGGGTRDPYAARPFLQMHTLPLRAMFFAEQAGRNPVPVWALGITLAVLLLACATVANLLLAQGASRAQEMALRLALGAPRWRIVRQLLLESLLIAICSAAAGLLIAYWSADLVRLLAVPEIPRLVDTRVVLFALGSALVTVLLFGIAPALWSARGTRHGVLRRTAGSSPLRLQNALMAAQVALGFVLLVGAGLFQTSFRNVLAIDTGFDLERLLEVRLDLRSFAPEERAQLISQALESLRQMPGIAAAAPGSVVPFYMFGRSGFTIIDGRADEDQPTSDLVASVGADWFTTMGIDMEEGRPFEAADARGEPVAVVTRELARRHWREGDAHGSCLRLERRHGDACVRVIGVTQDVRMQDLQGAPTPILFLLDAQETLSAGGGGATLFVRTSGEKVASILEPVRSRLQSLRRGMAFVDVRPLDDRVRPSRIPWEVAAKLFTVFGGVATLLASVGLYMVVTFTVRRQLRELGIRSALGSPSGAILRLVLGRGLRITVFGVAAGVVVAVLVTRLLASRLYGVSAADPFVWLGAAALLTGVGLAASLLPARAAARLDPLVVLRAE